jgi:hypothetical protein
VFNRLCASPLIVDFLETYPLNVAGAADYYKVIKSPMWLREVHSRLVEGTYDYVYDFAWDVRLVFANCMEYNAPDSDLCKAAEQLSTQFEHLLCDWVYNVQDVSIDDVAKGPWDEWMYLKYFDALNAKQNFCRETGTKAQENELNECSICDDQYLKDLVRGKYTKSKGSIPDESSWVCNRCGIAAQTPIISGSINHPPKSSVKACYSKDNFDGFLFFPAPEFGAGWCQAKGKKGGLKSAYLSPLGYELYSKEDVQTHKEFEKTVHDNLLASRESEYKEFREQVAIGRKPKGRTQDISTTSRHKRGGTTPTDKRISRAASSSSSSSSAETSGVVTSKNEVIVSSGTVVVEASEEVGMLSMGKLCDFATPNGLQVVWYTSLSHGEKQRKNVLSNVTLNESGLRSGLDTDTEMAVSSSDDLAIPTVESIVMETGSATTEISNTENLDTYTSNKVSAYPLHPSKVTPKGSLGITSTNIPNSGFFGLDELDIRLAIEALEGSEACFSYHFTFAADIRDTMIAECKSDLYIVNEKVNIDQRLLSTIVNEKWHWKLNKDNFYNKLRLPKGLSELRVEGLKEDLRVNIDTEVIAGSESCTNIDKDGVQGAEGAASNSEILASEHTPFSEKCKKDFSPLFPSNYTIAEGEMALVLWDFLHASTRITGELSFTLGEIMKCIKKPSDIVPSLGQTVFDEICTLFSGVLMMDFQRECTAAISDTIWQEYLLSKPLNIITWPFVMRSILLVSRQKFKALEALHMFNAPATRSGAMLQEDVMCLVFKHPLIEDFLYETKSSVTDVPVLRSSHGRSIFTVRYKCLCEIIPSRDNTGIYETLEDFADDLMGVFLDVVEKEAVNVKEIHATIEIISWLEVLFSRWNVDYTKDVVNDILASYREKGLRSSSTGVGGGDIRPLSPRPSASLWAKYDNDEMCLDPFTFSERFHDSSNGTYKLDPLNPDTNPDNLNPDIASSSLSYSPREGGGSSSSLLLSSERVLDSHTVIRTLEEFRYHRDIKALNAFERTLWLLRSSDPETWETADRMIVLSTFMDRVGDLELLKTQKITAFQNRETKMNYNSIEDIPNEPSAPMPLESVKVTSRVNVKCYFSGAESKYIDISAKWVKVPDILLLPPMRPVREDGDDQVDDFKVEDSLISGSSSSSSAASTTEGEKRIMRVRNTIMTNKSSVKNATGDHPVALETAVLKIAAAREYSYAQKKVQQDRAHSLSLVLPTVEYYRKPDPPLQLESLEPSLSRGNPLGLDRHGNEYWILHAQRKMPIVSQGSLLGPLNDAARAEYVNPQVLII